MQSDRITPSVRQGGLLWPFYLDVRKPLWTFFLEIYSSEPFLLQPQRPKPQLRVAILTSI